MEFETNTENIVNGKSGTEISKTTTNQPSSKTETATEAKSEAKEKEAVMPKRKIPDTTTEIEYEIPQVDDDLVEIVKHIKSDRQKLKKVLTEGRLDVEDLIMFCDKLNDITGQNMDSFVYYISHVHMKHKDKFSLTWNELYKILVQDWPLWESQNRKMEKVDEWIEEADENNYDHYDENDHNHFDEGDLEYEAFKDKGKYLMKMKLDKHHEKVTDIFRTYSFNMPKSDSDSDDFTTTKKSLNQSKTKMATKTDFLSRTEKQTSLVKRMDKSEVESKTDKDDKTDRDDKTENDGKSEVESKTEKDDKTDNDGKTSKDEEESESKSHTTTKKTVEQRKDSMITVQRVGPENYDLSVPLVHVSKLSKVLKDLGYLCGILFLTKEEYMTGEYNPKKSNKAIIDKILKH